MRRRLWRQQWNAVLGRDTARSHLLNMRSPCSTSHRAQRMRMCQWHVIMTFVPPSRGSCSEWLAKSAAPHPLHASHSCKYRNASSSSPAQRVYLPRRLFRFSALGICCVYFPEIALQGSRQTHMKRRYATSRAASTRSCRSTRPRKIAIAGAAAAAPAKPWPFLRSSHSTLLLSNMPPLPGSCHASHPAAIACSCASK